ncbi:MULTISPECIES: OprD family outer membrane porin [Pseudomonas]|uniref:OprD family outer membrane porin n=1 Tax=Pseudomonas TaxID=286 RepID=UPI00089B07AF|nr:outer membrane porin, OprD family [Pseudomonas proteolytica]
MSSEALLGLSLIALSVSAGQVTMATEEKPKGFVEGCGLTILNRNIYFNRDFRKGQASRTGNGYSEEWPHGIIGGFVSIFTEGAVGAVGFGGDAFAMLGLNSTLATGNPVVAAPA